MTPASPQLSPSTASARLAAFAVLNDVFFQRKTLDEALARQPEFDALSSRDRGFVRLLVATVLKRAPEMDAVLATVLHEPLSALKPQQLVNVFRLGMAQLAFLETPPHAAVSTTVDLAEAADITHHKPLVNAVMRRLAQEGYPKKQPRDAGRANTPEWLWQQWMNDYGVETALDIATANLDEAPVDFSVKSEPEKWAQRLGAQMLPTGSLRRDSAGFVPELPGFADGDWWVQSAAAALPVKLMGDLRGRTVIDLCAAPGGKTAQLASAGALVTAVDRSPQRMARLRENLERLHLMADCITADGAVWQPPEKADAVLLDAPCTATGTLRHQPDVLWLKDIRDQDKMAALQRRLLVNAVQMLKPGGLLMYCTCSLQKAEGEAQVDWLLQQGLPINFSPLRPGDAVGIGAMLTARGDIRALPSHWPDIGGIDGFYIARLSRTG